MVSASSQHPFHSVSLSDFKQKKSFGVSALNAVPMIRPLKDYLHVAFDSKMRSCQIHSADVFLQEVA